MSERKNLCVLVALHPVDAVLAERLGADEARHAAERHARRIERAVVMQGGQVLIDDAEQTVAAFERGDAAVHAASEALERIREVAYATGEQSSASTEIARQVQTITEMADGTSGSMHSVVVAAEQLQGLAAELDALVGRFRC